jgi:hypothetical protein
MLPNRKKPGAAFWVTVVVVVALIGYPFLLGPAVWLQISGNWPESLIWADHIFDPARWAIEKSLVPVQRVCQNYLTWWAMRAGLPHRHERVRP